MNPIIEGLRGLGALMVLVHHYVFSLDNHWAEVLAGLHFLHAGVDLFFVLTGYLFAPLILGLRQQTVTVFLKRRIWRLYPMYLLSLILTIYLNPTPWVQILDPLIHHLFFLQTAPWQTLHDISYFNEVYWTLSVEAAFYLLVMAALFLTIAFASLKISAPAKLRFWSIATLSLLGFLIFYYWNYEPHNGNWVMRQAQLPALLLEFWFGMAVFYLKIKRPWLLLGLASTLLVVLYITYSVAWAASLSPRPFGWFNILAALAFALLLAGLLQLQAHMQRFTLLNWLAMQLGAISYSVYLLHFLILQITAGLFNTTGLFNTDAATSAWLHVIIATFITLLTSTILYRWYELPCRNFGRR